MSDVLNALVSGFTYSFFLRLFFGTAMFCLRLKRKPCFWLYMSLCLAVYLGFAVIALPIHAKGMSTSILVYLGWFTFSYLWLYFCFDEPPQTILFCCISGYTAQQLAGSVNVLFLHLLQHWGVDSLFQFPDNTILSWFTAQIIHIVVYLLIYSIVARKLKTRDLALKRSRLIAISVVALFADIILQLMAIENGILTERFTSSAVILGYNILCCLFVYFLLFSSLSDKHMQEDISALHQLLAQQQRQYMLSKETIDSINMKCHDLRHQIRRITRGTTLDQ